MRDIVFFFFLSIFQVEFVYVIQYILLSQLGHFLCENRTIWLNQNTQKNVFVPFDHLNHEHNNVALCIPRIFLKICMVSRDINTINRLN